MSDSNGHIKRQLNPFALPSETDARFTLLIFSALALALALADPLLQLINPEASNTAYNFPSAPPEGLPSEEFFAQNITFGMQMAVVALKALAMPIILFLIIIGMATLLYWDHPRRVRARNWMKGNNTVKDERLEREISALSAEAGLPETQKVDLGNDLSAIEGQAFGIGWPKTLRLGGGLRLLLRKSPETFRAVVRHELAHIVNRDIGRTYYAQALWISVVFVTIVPLFLIDTYTVLHSTFLVVTGKVGLDDLKLLFLEKYPAYFWITIQCLVLIVVIARIWAGILRVREIYADWRAALWGSKQSLMAILIEPEKQSRKKNFLFEFHPSRTERLSVLKYPRRLFDMTIDLPFIVGMLTAVILNGMVPIFILILVASGPAATSLSSWLILFARDHPGIWMYFFRLAINISLPLTWTSTILLLFLPLALITYLYSATLGLQVQRQAIADLIEHKTGIVPYLSLFTQAGMVSIGLCAGLIASPFSFLAPNTFSSGILVLFLLLAFSLFVWLVLVSLRFFSQQILGSHLKATQPTGKLRLLKFLGYLGFLFVVSPFIVLLVFINGSVANYGDIKLAILIALAASFLIPICQVFAFVLQQLILFVYRTLQPVHCPVCGNHFSSTEGIGMECPRCKASLGSWLFVN